MSWLRRLWRWVRGTGSVQRGSVKIMPGETSARVQIEPVVLGRSLLTIFYEHEGVACATLNDKRTIEIAGPPGKYIWTVFEYARRQRVRVERSEHELAP